MEITKRFVVSPLRDIWFIHGFTESSLLFSEVFTLQAFSNCNLFIPDLPGFGVSELPKEADIVSILDDLHILINSFSNERPISIVGHSMGGSIAVLMACKLVAECKKVQVINIDGLLLEEHNDTSSLFSSLNYQSSHAYKHFIDNYWSEKVGDNIFLERYLMAIRSTPDGVLHFWAKAMVSILAENRVLTAQSVLGSITTYVYGERSINLRNVSAAMELGIPMRSLGSCGHWPMLEEREAFWELMIQLIFSSNACITTPIKKAT